MASKPRPQRRKAKPAVNVEADAKATAAASKAKQGGRPDLDTEVARLSEINPLEYERIRDGEAARLGVRVKALDEEVSKLRKAKAGPRKPKSRAHLRLAASNGKPTGTKAPRRDMFAPVDIYDWPSASVVSGEPHTNDIRNVKAVLDAAGVQLRFDIFTGQSVATFNGKNTVLDDGVLRRLWTMIQSSNLRVTYPFTCDVISALAWECTFDSAIDLFNSVRGTWDGVVRAETLLIDEMGAEDTPYTRGATRLLFASLVRRGMGLESKCDETVILRGAQRLGKSTLFKFLISEELYQENLKMSHSTRELLELTLGKLIVEMAELSGIKKTDRDDVKNWFSRTFDEFSLKHEKYRTRRARRFIFVGTANEEGPIANMLEEDRRFVIIPVKKRANLDRVKRDRLQILAEAIEIEKAYGPILELHDELRAEACKARANVVARPEYEDTLAETFGGIISAKIAASDVYAFLGLRDRTAIGKYTRSTGGGINPIMERLGWKYTHPSRCGKRVRAFEKGDGAGWLSAGWPHGTQAPAEIEPDEAINPNWTPEYAPEVVPSKVVPEVVPEGRTAANPCGTSAFNDGTTLYNLNGEIMREQHSPTAHSTEHSGTIGGENLPSQKVCGGKVVPAAERANSTFHTNDLGTVQPAQVKARTSDGLPRSIALQANGKNGFNGSSVAEGSGKANRGAQSSGTLDRRSSNAPTETHASTLRVSL